jgi:hypothetical protein
MWVNATPRPLYPRKRPDIHCIGGWVGPRADLDGCEISRPNGIRSPDCPVRSESLYRLSYRGTAIFGRSFSTLLILILYFVLYWMCCDECEGYAFEQVPSAAVVLLGNYTDSVRVVFCRHVFVSVSRRQ